MGYLIYPLLVRVGRKFFEEIHDICFACCEGSIEKGELSIEP
jgi:hypothetical protein